MTFVQRIAGAAALGAGILVGGGLSAPPAQAAYIATLSQVGSNVVGTGSGSLDFNGLTFNFSSHDHAAIEAGVALVSLGPTSSANFTEYYGISGPKSFGTGGSEIYATTGSGDYAGILGGLVASIIVPQGYASGAPLGTSTDTWDGATFASLGLTPGTYVWTWGRGENADSFTLHIGTPLAVVEPGTMALLGGSLLLLGLFTRRGRRYAM